MTVFSLDNSGDARLAIQEIHRDYGLAGIDDESLISRLLPDLLPDSPREASLLRAAAGAKVGHLLTDRIAAGMPADAAVRDVTAIAADRLAFDQTALLWVVSEYARAMGHAIQIEPDVAVPGAGGAAAAAPAPPVPAPPVPADTAVAGALAAPPAKPRTAEPTRVNPQVAAAQYMPGRAGPVVPPAIDDISGVIRMPTPRRNTGLIVGGIIVAVLVLVGGSIGIAHALRTKPPCTAASCITEPTGTRDPATTHRASPSPSPSSSLSTTPVNASSVDLNDVMPKDIAVEDDCTTTGTPFVDNVSDYYSCVESDDSTLSGMSVWGYQFATKADYQAGVAQFNSKVDFSASRAGGKCPPVGTDGNVTWHRDDDDKAVLGHLECYTGNDKDKVYAWTDDSEFTLMVAETTGSQTFSQLDTWWGHNNNNSSDA